MIEPVPSTAAQKFVIGQESNRLRKAEQKEEIQMYLSFSVKLLFFSTQNFNRFSNFVSK